MNLQKYNAIKEAIFLYIPNIEDIFKNAIKYGSKIHLEEYIKAISNEEYCLHKELGVNESSVTRLNKKLFPNRSSSVRVCTYLLSLFEYKWCSKCKEVLPFEDFNRNASRLDGLNSQCRVCASSDRNEYQKEYQARRRACKTNQTPEWADLVKIKDIYNKCPEGYEVDHILPIKGELICGLHVAENLQYLKTIDNRIKGNRFIPQ